MGELGDLGHTGAPPLIVTRHFAAPRELVFRARGSADHVQHWFSPESCSVKRAEVDCRPGGVFNLCMVLPDGQEHVCNGHFVEVAPPELLVVSLGVTVAGAERFTALTTVTFAAQGGGTDMTVRQDYEIYDPDFIDAALQAPEGWRTTLDKLAREVERMRGMAVRSVVHGSFSLQRTYDAAPAQVFRALTDPAAKAAWFGAGDNYQVLERHMDVRPGGRERLKARWANGTISEFEAFYFDVVADTRLVYAYEMHMDGRKISVSLATMEIRAAGAGTTLAVTEQGAFLDGYDDAGSREHGTGLLLDMLGASLQPHRHERETSQHGGAMSDL